MTNIKLCRYISHVRKNPILFLGIIGARSRSPGGRYMKTQMCFNSLANGRILPKFLSLRHLMGYITYTQVFDLTYFSRSQRSNFDIFTICSNSCNYWADLHQILSCIHVHLIRIHRILPGFFIWPTFQGHGQVCKKLQSWHILLLFDLCSNLVCLYVYTKFRHDRISNMAVRQPSWKSNTYKSHYSWTNAWIISKFLS
jgi:hypothetical protein